jgi:plastocyanin
MARGTASKGMKSGPLKVDWRIVTAAALCWGCVDASSAANLVAQVSDARGASLRDAVVYLLPTTGAKPPGGSARAVVEQQDREFAPFVTVVRTGTAITFPNRDQLMHHVYSFSSAKNFQIKLYEGDPPTPIVFDKPGVVALGCNIHDWMRAYVVVVDTPYFAATDNKGLAHIANLPAGSYELRAWHPYAVAEWHAEQTVAGTDQTAVSISLAVRAPVLKAKPPLDPTKY